MKLTDILTYVAPLNRRGMFSTWHVKVGDHTSVAPTKEQAEQESVRVLKEALTGSYTPEVLFYKQHYALIWRETTGWQYEIRPIGDSARHGTTLGFNSKQECVDYASKHLEGYEE